MVPALPPEQRIKFFVYVIESPSAVDLYHERREADLIRRAVALNCLESVSRLAVNLEAFSAAIRIGLREEMEARPGWLPVLHISAHGFSEGIQLASGEILKWSQLRSLLLPVNEELKGQLLVCMSTCEGYAGTRMAMELHDGRLPFYALVGNSSKPTWSETGVAFASFYHLFANGHYLLHAVEAMRMASGNETFFLETAEQSKQGYLEFLKKLEAETAPAVEVPQLPAPGGPLSKNLANVPSPVTS